MRNTFLIGACLALTACGGGSDDGNQMPIVSISTSDGTTLFAELQPVQLNATATDAEDGELDVTWTQTAGPEIALEQDGSQLSFSAPKVHGNMQFGFRAMAEDSEGSTGSAELEITIQEQVSAIFISRWDDAPDMHVHRKASHDLEPVSLHGTLDPLPVDSGTALSGYDLHTLGLSVSPDHRFVAYRSDRDGDFEYELYVAALDGSGEHLLADSTFGVYGWSPDSRKLAFLQRPDEVMLLSVVPFADDGSPTSEPINIGGESDAIDPVTGNPAGGIYNFGWHPASDRILIRGELDQHGVYELWQVRINPESGVPIGGREKLSGVITPHASGETVGVRHFDIAPDGSHVAYRADKATPEIREMYVTPLAPLADTVKVSGAFTGTWTDTMGVVHNGMVRDFAWSADGQLLAFRGDIVEFGKNELFVVATPTDGEMGLRQTVNGAEMLGDLVDKYVWAPDGNRLAYTVDVDATAGYEVHLYVAAIDVDGTVSEREKATGEVVPNGFANKPAWAPDGSRLAVWGDLEQTMKTHVYVTTLDANGMPDGNLERVSHDITNPSGGYFHYQWSPNSEWIAYNGDPNHEGINELFLVNVANPELRFNPTGTINVSDGNDANGPVDGEMRDSTFWTHANGELYKWAPNSREIYFQGDLDRNEVIELYAFPVSSEVSTGERRTISSTVASADGQWHPLMDVEDGVIEFIVIGPPE